MRTLRFKGFSGSLRSSGSSRTRFLLGGIFAVLTSLLLFKPEAPAIRYTKGQTWEKPDLTAPFSFPIRKPKGQYAAELAEAQEQVPWVFLNTEDHANRQIARADDYLGQVEAILQGAPKADSWEEVRPAMMAQIQELDFRATPAQLEALWAQRRNFPAFRQLFLAALREVYTAGIVDRSLAEAPGPFVSLRETPSQEVRVESRQVFDGASATRTFRERLKTLDPQVASFLDNLFNRLGTPNYRFSERLYEQELGFARESVSPTYGKVQRKELIVARGQVITAEVALIIDSLNAEQANSPTADSAWLRYLGQLLLMVLLTVIIFAFLRTNRRELFYRTPHLIMLLGIYLIMMASVKVVTSIGQLEIGGYTAEFFLLVPLCIAPILVTIFFDDRIGYFSNIAVAMLGAFIARESFAFFFIHSLAGSFAVFNLKYLRQRGQFFLITGNLLVVYAVAYSGWTLLQTGSLSAINPANLALIVLNIFFTLGTYPLVYLFERLFGITSNLTYLELLDTDHPLLKRLAISAPGTYHHSLHVASIAEEAAKRINANPLLVHAGALFHDIGKLSDPSYFVENQGNGANPHDNISPLQSASAIIRHVTYGTELAKEHRLPDEIIDFIRTHHGTTRVEYFYRKYARENPDAVDELEGEFRYPGPVPTRKEDVVLMIADSVEAAARAMPDPTPERLERLVHAIISSKMNDDQFERSRISFRELNKVKREVTRQVQSLYHGRIAYPSTTPATAAD